MEYKIKSIPFKTTPEQIISLAQIIIKMNYEKVNQKFIIAASKLAQTDQ